MSAPLDDERVPPNRVLSHLGVMAAVSVVMGVVMAGLAIPFAGVIGITARNVSDSMQDLPADLETRSLPQRTRILAADGSTIATLFDENRVNVSLNQIAKVMRQAILSIEDYRFYQHGALDLKGTMRALVTNQAAGDVVQGGSSITQQMVKLTLLSQAETQEEKDKAQEQTFSRKIRELRYAIAFEEKHTKDWILERYLNIAYFGDGVYGVQAAARHFFSVNAKDLNLRQAATLAGLVKNPVGYDPTAFPDRALVRRNLVLERMAELRVISPERAVNVGKKKLGLKVTPNRNGCMDSRAPFFCDYVLSYLLRDTTLGATQKDRKRLLTSGGLTIRTTVDLRFQDAADESVRRHVYPTDNAIGALAMLEPRTGNVRAIAQSRQMGGDTKQGKTFLNYVVNDKYGDSAGFSAGSTFKAFVLAAAIKQGIPLTTVINSPREVFLPENSFEDCDGPYRSNAVWSPQNSTSDGAMNLYTGTALSVNTFFAQLSQRTGICEPFKLAKAMGVDLTAPRGDKQTLPERTPAFTLGFANASPLEMAEAYATFAGRGLHCEARPVTAILDSNRNKVKDYPKTCTQVLPGAVADAVNDVLQGVTGPGGFGQRIAPQQPSAGKTGTAQRRTSVWFVGYTPNLAAAATIAGVTSGGQPASLPGMIIGGNYITDSAASGSGFAGPIWGDAMKVVEQWLDDVDFEIPPPGEIAGFLVSVPSVGGQTVESATRTLEDMGFVVSVASGEVDSSYARGLVAYTAPRAGSQTGSGDTITLYISDGSPYVPPPPPKKPTKKPGGGGGGDDDGDREPGGGGGGNGGGGGGNGGGGDGDD